jgi:hypothetical protein
LVFEFPTYRKDNRPQSKRILKMLTGESNHEERNVTDKSQK